jgi:serine protease Do
MIMDMSPIGPRRDRLSCRPFAVVAVACATLAGEAAAFDAVEVPPQAAEAFRVRGPRDVQDLRHIEWQLQRVVPHVTAATVLVQAGRSTGSGVVVSGDGRVLTAAHVIGRPGRRVTVVFADGRRLSGQSLGADHDADAGMVQIDRPPDDLPFLPLAEAKPLESGEWVITAGQPGGMVDDRSPPIRLGRVLFVHDDVVCTDCTLVGGDSGGPLVNMRGEVVGIHSSIGPRVTHNFHVPITAFQRDWDRLAASELWGGGFDRDPETEGRPLLGVAGRTEEGRCRVTQVFPGMPAESAGVRSGDVIRAVDGREIDSFERLTNIIFFKQPGGRVTLSVERSGEELDLEVELGAAPDAFPGRPPAEGSER